jgi:hypothetical protein
LKVNFTPVTSHESPEEGRRRRRRRRRRREV